MVQKNQKQGGKTKIEKTIEQLERKIRELREAHKEVEKRAEQLEQLRDACRNDQWEATAKLRAEIEAVKKPFNTEIEKLERDRSRMYTQSSNILKDIKVNEAKLAELKAINAGAHDDTSFAGWLFAHKIRDVDRSYDGKIVVKKPLRNGIQIFTFRGSDVADWYAFDGLRLVGYLHHDLAMHRGDSTEGYGYVGDMKCHLTSSHWSFSGYYPHYKDWAHRLEIADVAELATTAFECVQRYM